MCCGQTGGWLAGERRRPAPSPARHPCLGGTPATAAATPRGSACARTDCPARPASGDYFPTKVAPKHAKGFTVEYFATYKVVKSLAAGAPHAHVSLFPSVAPPQE